jgi:hypothetical protein
VLSQFRGHAFWGRIFPAKMNAGLLEVRGPADGTLAARSRAKIRHVPLQGQLHKIYQISRA